jgi:hypothetical protein
MKGQKLFFFFLALAVFLPSGILWTGADMPWQGGVVLAQEGWLKEFEDICAKTQDAMALGTDELKGLIARCDALKPLIDKLPETQRKVYLKRLQGCRDLYVFVLESKQNQ